VTAIEAGKWLDKAMILGDSTKNPGLPLRNLLRAKRIKGQHQEISRRWFIQRVEG
jgi:hypothetical protein